MLGDPRRPHMASRHFAARSNSVAFGTEADIERFSVSTDRVAFDPKKTFDRGHRRTGFMECAAVEAGDHSPLIFDSRMTRPYSLYCVRRKEPKSVPHTPTVRNP